MADALAQEIKDAAGGQGNDQNAKTRTKWRKRTARLRISVGDDYARDARTKTSLGEESEFAQSQVSARANAKHRDRRAYRCRQNDTD